MNSRSMASFPKGVSGAWVGFAISALVVVIGGLWLTGTGDKLAVATGLGRTFVGSIVFAIITSFPEIVTCIAAVRVGAPDLAIANIFGSNMFNLVLIPITDAAYRSGSLLHYVSRTHVITALLGIFLTVAAFLSLVSLIAVQWIPSFDGEGEVFGFLM